MKQYKNIFITIGLLAVICLGIFYIKASTKQPNSKVDSKRNFKGYLDFKPVTMASNAFRLDRSEKELFIVSEDKIDIFPMYASIKPYQILTDEGWNVFKIGDSIFVYGEKKNCLYSVQNEALKFRTKASASDDNILFTENHFFYGNELSKLGTKYVLKDSENPSFTCNLSQVLESSLKGMDSMCEFNYLEGILVDYSASELIFLPYRISKFVIVDKITGKARLMKSIDDRIRVNLKSIETKMPDGGTMITCESIDGSEMVQSAASTSSKWFFVLTTNVVDTLNSKFQIIDVYKKSDLNYLYSLKIKLVEKSFLIDLEYIDNQLYLLSNKGEVIKAFFNG